MNDREIIALLCSRDEKGIDALVQHYGPLMRYIISPILSSREDREECLSEVSLRVWEKIHQFDPERGSWSTWLTAVTRNTALNLARRNLHRAEGEELPENTPSPDPTPEERVIQQEREKQLMKALDGLNQKERLLFYRKYYYLQTTAQIASELGMTERAVEGKLYRIKKRLRKVLGGEGCGA